jgi:hypothetical protein
MTLIMNDKYKRIIEMSALPLMLLFLSAVALTFQSCTIMDGMLLLMEEFSRPYREKYV